MIFTKLSLFPSILTIKCSQAESLHKRNLYINLAYLSVCLFVCIQETSKRLNRSGPNVGLYMSPGMVYRKSPKYFFIQSVNFFCFCFAMYLYKEKMFTIKKEDGREAPQKPSKLNLLFVLHFKTFNVKDLSMQVVNHQIFSVNLLWTEI